MADRSSSGRCCARRMAPARGGAARVQLGAVLRTADSASSGRCCARRICSPCPVWIEFADLTKSWLTDAGFAARSSYPGSGQSNPLNCMAVSSLVPLMKILPLRSYRLPIALSLSLTISACAVNNGWGRLEERAQEPCQRAFRLWRDVAEAPATSRQRVWNGESLGEKAWTAECVRIVAPALQPCTEYKYGTDSAIQCVTRYGEAALKFASADICARYAPQDQGRDECEQMAAEASGDSERMLRAIEKLRQSGAAGALAPSR